MKHRSLHGKIKHEGPFKTEEEMLVGMTIEYLKNTYTEHDCYPGNYCKCKYCEEYRKRINPMKVKDSVPQTKEEILETSVEQLRYIYWNHIYKFGINCNCDACEEYKKRTNQPS